MKTDSPLDESPTVTIAPTELVQAAAEHAKYQRQLIGMVLSIAYSNLLPTICVFGILGNMLNLITLRSPLLQAASYMYVRGLAVADMGCMLFIFAFVLRQAKQIPGTAFAISWFAAHLELPLINFFIAAGVLTIVALTIDRYTSIVWPLYYRESNTPWRARIIIFFAYCLSAILYVPMIWKKRVILSGKYCNNSGYPVSEESNISMENCTYSFADNPNLILRWEYVVYKWFREAVLRLLPILALAYFNTHIIAHLKVFQRKRVQLTGGSYRPGQGGSAAADARNAIKNRQQENLLFLLGGIVILFFVCNIPAAINLVFIKDTLKGSIGYQIFRATANLLEIANHAVNFYIFCMCSKDYRKEFLNRFPVHRCFTQLRQVIPVVSMSSFQSRLSSSKTNRSSSKRDRLHDTTEGESKDSSQSNTTLLCSSSKTNPTASTRYTKVNGWSTVDEFGESLRLDSQGDTEVERLLPLYSVQDSNLCGSSSLRAQTSDADRASQGQSLKSYVAGVTRTFPGSNSGRKSSRKGLFSTRQRHSMPYGTVKQSRGSRLFSLQPGSTIRTPPSVSTDNCSSDPFRNSNNSSCSLDYTIPQTKPTQRIPMSQSDTFPSSKPWIIGQSPTFAGLSIEISELMKEGSVTAIDQLTSIGDDSGTTRIGSTCSSQAEIFV